MGFWIFMFVMVLLTPFTMIIFGNKMSKTPKGDINKVSGYRTSRSMKNQDTWIFAQKLAGKIWLICGSIILAPSIIAMIAVYNKTTDIVGMIGGATVFLQGIIMVSPFILVENALKKNFDENGNKIVR